MRGPGASSRASVVVMALLSVMIVSHVEAQVIRGTIRDAGTNEPVVLAYVGLLAPGRELVVAALADNSGGFSLQAPAGDYFIYVSRMGYQTVLDGLFEIGEDGVFDLQIGLKPAVIDVEGLVVEAESRVSNLERVGLLDRAAIGLGTFILADEIQRRAVDKLADAFRMIPGIDVLDARPLAGPDAMQNPEIRVRRGGGDCSPTLYVDGAIVAIGSRSPNARPVRPDDFVTPFAVEAVEIYTRTSQVPVQYEGNGQCGVVLIWTFIR